MRTWDLDSGETLYEDGYMKTTATPAVHACQPLKPTLPEPPFTIAQIMCNFDIMRHTHNIEWCHNIARDVMERGISGCDQCAQGYCCPLNEVTKDRDYWRQGCVNALLVISDLHVERDELRQSLTGFLAVPMTRENEDAMRQAMIALGLKPHAPKMM